MKNRFDIVCGYTEYASRMCDYEQKYKAGLPQRSYVPKSLKNISKKLSFSLELADNVTSTLALKYTKCACIKKRQEYQKVTSFSDHFPLMFFEELVSARAG